MKNQTLTVKQLLAIVNDPGSEWNPHAPVSIPVVEMINGGIHLTSYYASSDVSKITRSELAQLAYERLMLDYIYGEEDREGSDYSSTEAMAAISPQHRSWAVESVIEKLDHANYCDLELLFDGDLDGPFARDYAHVLVKKVDNKSPWPFSEGQSWKTFLLNSMRRLSREGKNLHAVFGSEAVKRYTAELL